MGGSGGSGDSTLEFWLRLRFRLHLKKLIPIQNPAPNWLKLEPIPIPESESPILVSVCTVDKPVPSPIADYRPTFTNKLTTLGVRSKVSVKFAIFS